MHAGYLAEEVLQLGDLYERGSMGDVGTGIFRGSQIALAHQHAVVRRGQ